MNPDEILVGGLAIVFAVLGFSIGIGPWEKPYQLSTFQRVRERHGKPAARAAWIILSIAFLLVGIAALMKLRPSYATPASVTTGIGDADTGASGSVPA